jgi:hypothetical protein
MKHILGNDGWIVKKMNQNYFNYSTYQYWLEISHVDLTICVYIFKVIVEQRKQLATDLKTKMSEYPVAHLCTLHRMG